MYRKYIEIIWKDESANALTSLFCCRVLSSIVELPSTPTGEDAETKPFAFKDIQIMREMVMSDTTFLGLKQAVEASW